MSAAPLVYSAQFLGGEWHCAYRTPGMQRHYTSMCACMSEEAAKDVARQMNQKQRVTAASLKEERKLSGFRPRL